MFQGNSNYENDIYQNVPNMSLMFTMYSPMFGNGNFIIQPASPGEVQDGFPSIPYLPLEAMIYQQMSSNPYGSGDLSSGGQSGGQNNISGTQTVYDGNGTSRYQIGVS